MITIDSLVDDFGFEITYLAGQRSGSKPLSWAHVIDLEDPWNWIGSGELILTTGAGIPPAERQEEWLALVIGSGANGLVLASRPGTEPLGRDALRLADREGFPILTASFSFRFATLAKEVINQALQRSSKRLAVAQRVFGNYSASLVRDEPMSARLRGIARSVGVHFEITDAAGNRLFETGAVADNGLVESTSLDGWIHPHSARLRMVNRHNDPVDPALMQSSVTVIALELQRRMAEVRLRSQTATILAEDIFAGRRPLADLAGFLTQAAPESFASFSVLAIRLTVPSEHIWERLLAPDLWQIPWAGFERKELFIVIFPATEQHVSALETALGDCRAGISRPISEENTPESALGQASLASDYATDECRFKRAEDLLAAEMLLPADRERCRAIARTYLSALHLYDVANGTELLRTLEVFYQEDRSPSKTSERLYIHRHTLVYRLKSIKKTTGLDPSATKNVATFWIALEAARRSGWPNLESGV